MLDFSQLVAEINAMADAHSIRSADLNAALATAEEQIRIVSSRWEELADLLRGREWPWVMAIPREPFDYRGPAPDPPTRYAVVASDGSQIAPDRHEVSRCYLLNISQIRLSYGDSERP